MLDPSFITVRTRSSAARRRSASGKRVSVAADDGTPDFPRGKNQLHRRTTVTALQQLAALVEKLEQKVKDGKKS